MGENVAYNLVYFSLILSQIRHRENSCEFEQQLFGECVDINSCNTVYGASKQDISGTARETTIATIRLKGYTVRMAEA